MLRCILTCMFSKYSVRKIFYSIFKRFKSLFFTNRFGVSLSFYANSDHYYVDSLENGFSFGSLAVTSQNVETAKKYIENFQFISYKNSPKNFAIEKNLQILIYLLTLIKQPRLVVETGVANGVSTQILLNSLMKYDGYLHSFDINPDSEEVAKEYSNWDFHLLTKSNSWDDLVRTANLLGKIDFWIHDSDHSFFWQYSEYNFAYEKLRLGGVLISDDIDTSEAWFLFCQKYNLKSYIFLDKRKLIGFVIK